MQAPHVRERKLIFRSPEWNQRVGSAKTTLWHLNQLAAPTREAVALWVIAGGEKYRYTRYWLAQWISRFTIGFNRRDTEFLNRRAISILKANVAAANN